MKSEEKRIRDILDKARRCVLRGQAPQGIAYLETIRLEIDDFAGTPLRAEYELIYAGALGAMRDPGTEDAFADTFIYLAELAEPDPSLNMRARGDFGKYLAEQKSFKRARVQYRLAEKIAETLEQSEEDLAHYEMCLLGIELQEKGDPQLRAFQNLRRAATIEDGAGDADQHEAWFHYIDEYRTEARQMLAARKGNEPTVDYFRGVLSEIKRRRGEPVK